MTQARIEIRTRDVKSTRVLNFFNDHNDPFGPGTKGAPQHLFIVHVDGSGQETVIRGGPAKGNELLDDIGIVKVPYGKKVNGGKPSIDFVENAPRVIIAQGTDSEMQVLVDRMWSKAQEINQAGYDYKIGYGQNSNTVVKVLVDHVGIPLKLPQHHDGSNIWVPGIQISEFTHTLVDKLIKESGNEFKAAGENYVEYLKSINALKDKSSDPEEAFQSASTPNPNPDSTPHSTPPHTNNPFSWNDPSTWTYDFWDKPQTTLFEKQQDLFQNYKLHERVIEGNKITSTFTYSNRRAEDKKWAA